MLKKEKRSLEQEIEELKRPDNEKSKVQAAEVILEDVNDNVVVRSHIQSLNDMIGEVGSLITKDHIPLAEVLRLTWPMGNSRSHTTLAQLSSSFTCSIK